LRDLFFRFRAYRILLTRQFPTSKFSPGAFFSHATFRGLGVLILLKEKTEKKKLAGRDPIGRMVPHLGEAAPAR